MLRRLSAALLWVKMMRAFFFFLAIYLVTQIAFLATSSAASAAGKSSSQVGIITGLVVGLVRAGVRLDPGGLLLHHLVAQAQ